LGLLGLKSEILVTKVKVMQMIVPCSIVSGELEVERGWTYMLTVMDSK